MQLEFTNLLSLKSTIFKLWCTYLFVVAAFLVCSKAYVIHSCGMLSFVRVQSA